MGLFGRFGSWSDQASTELPPTEILATLVDDLYAPVASFAIGAVTAALVGGIAAWRTGNPLLTILTICTVAVASARLFITLEYRKRNQLSARDRGGARPVGTVVRNWRLGVCWMRRSPMLHRLRVRR